MENNLFPINYGTTEMTESDINYISDTPIGYKKSVNFDYIAGDITRDGMNRIQECSPYEAWVQWCVKVLQTPRYKCAAYSTDVGINIEDALGSSDRNYAESVLKKDISEALTSDPSGRTSYVESIDFNWNTPDSVDITVTVIGIDQEKAVLSASIQ